MKARPRTVVQAGDAVRQLCPACGLCCNGVLFGDVELQKSDDAKRLRSLGMELFLKGRQKCFAQPCSCFDGKFCSIYDDRPRRCRTFECRLLMRVQSGEISGRSALAKIKKARQIISQILRLLRDSGNTDEHLPLNRRYAEVGERPINLAGERSELARRRKLMLAVGRLTRLLESDYLT
ncbi:MAG TPA: YkgJ family cysteine cluster protein [Verrucomicrobiota bacterium]|nr:YkgJ family cysteine cluster protein [Verrucomicrobiota bacterium]